MTDGIVRKAQRVAAMAVTLAGAPAWAAEPGTSQARLPAATQSLEIPFEDMKFSDSGFAAYGPRRPDDHSGRDIMVSDAYGKVTSGPHATITKFPQGFRSVLHSHTGTTTPSSSPA